MSKFTDYNTVSKLYDESRTPIGMEVYIGSLVFHLKKPLSDIHILDAGCGTGSYAKALLEAGVGSITMVDGSEGMLEQAKGKLREYVEAGKVKLITKVILPKLPFEEKTFDCVMINQVLHHLADSKNEDPHTLVWQTMKEAERVLKSTGVILINTCSTLQCYKGFWFTGIPEVTGIDRYSACYPPIDKLEKLIEDRGLKVVNRYTPNTAVLMGNVYFEAERILEKTFREGDSFWRILTKDETEEALSRARNLKEEGKLVEKMKELDCERVNYGQCSVIVAVRK